MKKLSKFVMCVLLILVVSVSAVLLTACNEEETPSEVVTIPTYKVVFYRNYPGEDATNTTVNQTVQVKRGGTVSEKTVTEPTRVAGYTFSGWYTTNECTEEFDFSQTVNGNLSVFAGWTANGHSTDVALTALGQQKLVEQKETVKYFDSASNASADKQVSTGVWRFQYNANSYQVPNNPAGNSFSFTTNGFRNYISATATYVMYTDAACKKTASDTVALVNGNNYYYMKVTAEDTIATAVYKINIYLEPVYKVTVVTVSNSGTSKTKNIAHGAYLNENEFPTADVNPGYRFIGWYYDYPYKLNSDGKYVDKNGAVLDLASDGNFYYVNEDGDRYPVYIDKDGKKAIRLGDLYYKADKNGNFIYENNDKIELAPEDLYNSVDENGLPVYETGKPVSELTGSYKNVWDFDIAIDKSITIYGIWEAMDYTITFDLVDPNAKYSGNMTATVKYGIEAYALGDIIKAACAGAENMPKHDYAEFMGWEYNGVLYVNSTGVGLKGWSIPNDATLTAKWKYNSYTVNVSSANTTMGTVSGGGNFAYNYVEPIIATAIPEPGYEFVNWTINGNVKSTSSPYSYRLNLGDLYDGAITIRANFRKVSVPVTLDYKLDVGENPISNVTNITATFGNALYGTGANFLPVINAKTSPNGQRLFVGWYIQYTDDEGILQKIVLTDKDTPKEGFENWNAHVITVLKNIQTNGGTPTLCIEWKDNVYDVKVYNAFYSSANMGGSNISVLYPNQTAGTMVDIVFDSDYILDKFKLTGKELSAVVNTKFGLVTTVNDNAMYVFKGWYYLDLSRTNPIASLTDEDKVTDEDDATEGVQFTLHEQDVAVVGVWYYQPVTVTLNNYDGTSFKTIQIDIDSTALIGITAEQLIPTRVDGADYDFVGWVSKGGKLYIDNNGAIVSKIVNPELITADGGLTLTAKWQKKNYFIVNEGVITGITADGLTKTALEIPTDDGIFAIGNEAFKGNTTLEKLTVNGNIISIGEYAFSGSKIKQVIFNGEFKGLKVEAFAFENCGIESIDFPDGTLSIAQFALAGCSKLKSLTYSAEIPVGMLFNTEEPETGSWYQVEQNNVTYFIPNSLVTVSISHTVDTVCDYAFMNCIKIKTVNLARPIANSDKKYTKTIGMYAFAVLSEYAKSQTDKSIAINLADVEAIKYCAFAGSGITSTDFNALISLGTSAFRGSALTAVSFANTYLDSISANCFQDCLALTSVNYGMVKYIEQYAFANCANYTDMPASSNANRIKMIGMYAYFNSGITAEAVTQLTGVEKVDQYAFKDSAWDKSATTGIMVVGNVLYFYKSGDVANLANKANVVSIAMSAFKGSQVIGTADFSTYTNLKYIYNNAFEDSSVTSVILPASLIDIKENAFRNCALTNINMSACVNLQRIGIAAFANNKNLTTVTFRNDVLDDTSLSSSIKLAIAVRAFEGCTALTTITLPDTLGSLGEYAFKGCAALATVNFVKNTKYEDEYVLVEGKWEQNEGGEAVYSTTTGLISRIEAGSFMGCTSLNNLELPYFITEISDYAFAGCVGLTNEKNVYASTTDKNTGEKTYDTNLRSLGKYAFEGASNLATLNMGTKVNFIGEGVFKGCASLTKISIKSVSSIPAYAFDGCVKLTEANVASSLSLVGDMAFQNCTNLITFTATNGVSEVGAKAFKNCYQLATVKLSSAGTSKIIGSQAFQNCSAITSITIPSSTETIGDGAFMGCTSLSAISFASNTTLLNVGTSAFFGCIELVSISLPSSVKNVGESAFASCERLTSVTIGENISFIGERAFCGCDNITVTFSGLAVPDIGGEIFDSVNFTIVVRRGYKNSFLANNMWAIYSANIIESAE